LFQAVTGPAKGVVSPLSAKAGEADCLTQGKVMHESAMHFENASKVLAETGLQMIRFTRPASSLVKLYVCPLRGPYTTFISSPLYNFHWSDRDGIPQKR